jgi:hypothetical protein
MQSVQEVALKKLSAPATAATGDGDEGGGDGNLT